jgi:3-oxoadipate enol-lactonase
MCSLIWALIRMLSDTPSPLHYLVEGSGPPLVLSHALSCDLSMWDATLPLLTPHFSVLRYDHRGQGKSPTGNIPFEIDDLADDAAALIRQWNRGPVAFCGLSMGGMVAQALALRYPDLVSHLIIANAAAQYDAAARIIWQTRIDTVRTQGMAAIAQGVLARWFTEAFLHKEGAQTNSLRQVFLANEPQAYAATCAAVANINFIDRLGDIKAPTLVIAADQDAATPPAMSEVIAKAAPGAQLQMIKGAAHLSAVESPYTFARLMIDFLS